MTSFLALYRGDTVGSAKMVAVTADEKLINDFAVRMLCQPTESERLDPVLDRMEAGRRQALGMIARETA